MRTLAGLVLSLSALGAAAQTPPAPPPGSAPLPGPVEPSWSVGAGIFFSSQTVFLFPGGGGSATSQTWGNPGFAASVERALGGRTWLVLGGFAALDRSRTDVPPGVIGPTRTRSGQVLLDVGVRRALTPPGAPVEVSLLALAQVGSWSVRQEWNSPPPVGTTTRESAWTLGVEGGIALDRELARDLVLRIATPLVDAGWSEGRTEVEGSGTLHSSDAAIRLTVQPRLELRMAF